MDHYTLIVLMSTISKQTFVCDVEKCLLCTFIGMMRSGKTGSLNAFFPLDNGTPDLLKLQYHLAHSRPVMLLPLKVRNNQCAIAMAAMVQCDYTKCKI